MTNLKTAAIHLKLAVTGAAREGMRRDDYQQLKQSLEKRYELSKEDARSQLKHAKRRKGEDIFAYGERLRKLVCQANPDLKDGAADEATITEVLDTLGDPALRRELKALGKIEFQDAIKHIGEYLTEMERENKDLLAIRKVAVEEVPDVSSSLAEAVKQMEARLTKQFAEMMQSYQLLAAAGMSTAGVPSQEKQCPRECVITAVRPITTNATVHFPGTLEPAASANVEVKEVATSADNWVTSYVIAQDWRQGNGSGPAQALALG